ncbi:MAG: S8 family serine peptidase [Calditrichia bacterium]
MKFVVNTVLTVLVFVLFAHADLPRKVNAGQNLIGKNSKQQIQVKFEAASPIDNKIDPLLKHLITETESGTESMNLLAEKYESAGLIQLEAKSSGELMVSVFIKSTNILQTRDEVMRSGGTFTSQSGNILVANLPVSAIRSLAEGEEVTFIETNVYSHPKLDVSNVVIEADKVHAGTGLPQSYNGDGVVVGVLDSGIDWAHDDFYDFNGSRIQYLWDMSVNDNPPSGYNYGTEFTKAQIDAGQCTEFDGDDGGGHGTHVSATAAGNDNSLPGYTGIAPESDIVFVKGFRNGPGFANTDVVDGCSYIFSKAQAMGQPAVINLSLGGHFGAHDGSSLYEQSLSNLTGPGKVIVAAAGNEGSGQIHLSYQTGGSSPSDARLTYWIINPNTPMSVVDMWYTPGNISVGVAAFDATGNLLGYTNPVAPGQNVQNLAFDIGGGVILGIVSIDASTINDPNNNDSRVSIMVDSNNGTYNLNAVYWAVYTFGSGSLDAWVVSGGLFTVDDDPVNYIYPGDNNKSIGMPGTSHKIVCVGSFVTKNQWIDIDGNTQVQPGNITIGDISSFSSRGPSRDNRMKPDIAAPGEVIVAALSSGVTVGGNGTPRSNILAGGKHQKMQGTSMASPHVTGTVALMLQKNPALNYDETVAILKSSADKDNFTGSSANNNFGSGKLNAFKAIQATPGGGNPNPIVVMQEGFDNATFPPANWTTQVLNQANTWQSGNPTSSNFNTIDPTSVNSAICPWVAENQDEWLITPEFSLSAGSTAVEFYAGYSTNWLTGATLKMHISSDGGANWTELWEAENDGQGWLWRQKSIDLSSYANQQHLKLAWQYVGNDGDLVALDGIKVQTNPATGIGDEKDNRITDYALYQNYPNPFNPVTTISFNLPRAENIKLLIFNVLGEKVEEVVSGRMNAGHQTISWNAANYPSGIYYYRLDAGSFRETKKMILLK